MPVAPNHFVRRSFVYPRLVAAGAEFSEVGDAAVASAFPGGAPPPLGLADLSPLARTGVKGPRALEWTREQDWPVPEENNTSRQADDGAIVCRLGDGELVVLGTPGDGGASVRALAAAIPGGGAWEIPRRDSNCWFFLRGADASSCLQKLCGVDLREHAFAHGAIAQTSVARLNAVVCRGFDPGEPGFHLLADSASALWFWDALLDAMEEFNGGPVGLHALPQRL